MPQLCFSKHEEKKTPMGPVDLVRLRTWMADHVSMGNKYKEYSVKETKNKDSHNPGSTYEVRQ